MRNRLVHEYGRIDVVLVWGAAEHDVPRLIELLEGILASEHHGHGAPGAAE